MDANEKEKHVADYIPSSTAAHMPQSQSYDFLPLLTQQVAGAWLRLQDEAPRRCMFGDLAKYTEVSRTALPAKDTPVQSLI